MGEIRARSILDDEPEDITSINRTLSVNSNYVHRVGVNAKFHRALTLDTVTTAAIAVDDTVISLASVTGLAVGDKIALVLGLAHGEMFYTVTVIATLDVTIDMPIPVAVDAGAQVREIETNLASAVGTLATPIIYSIHPPAGTIWDISRLMFTMTSTTDMDDTLFGANAALAHGLMLRSDTDELRHMEIWKTNSELALTMFNLEYSDKAPAGSFGLKARWTLTESDYSLRLNGDDGDSLILYIQDDISTNATLYVNAQGKVFGS